MEDNSHSFGHFQEPDYTSSYSPWSCDTFGSYIGSKDIKSKEGMNSMDTVSFACLEVHKGFSSSCIFTNKKKKWSKAHIEGEPELKKNVNVRYLKLKGFTLHRDFVPSLPHI